MAMCFSPILSKFVGLISTNLNTSTSHHLNISPQHHPNISTSQHDTIST